MPSVLAPAEVAVPSPERDAEKMLTAIREELGDCRRCRLCSDRNHLVFGEGSPKAPLVFVGEGPGFDEDRQGRPFVGRAGKLLDKMILALGFDRGDVYICNVVKCRPPKNRTPDPEEIKLCSPFLLQQLEAIHPRAICALGACAAQTLLQTSQPISALRRKIHSWRGIPLAATYHPAYLLRTPSQKAAAWQDLLAIRQLLADAG
jgi:DNA polymerase